MSKSAAAWVGADPGGDGAFGIAILQDGKSPQLATLSYADEAVAFLLERLEGEPGGMGVDAPLWWSSGQSSDRHADRWLRKRYKLKSGTVQAANSLRGAALVQGAMFIQRVREAFPEVRVTEAHPKAVLKAVYGDDWAVFSERHQVPAKLPSEHERDAIIAAIAAREGFQGQWSRDLSTTRLPDEQDPLTYWLAPVHYFWPAD